MPSGSSPAGQKNKTYRWYRSPNLRGLFRFKFRFRKALKLKVSAYLNFNFNLN